MPWKSDDGDDGKGRSPWGRAGKPSRPSGDRQGIGGSWVKGVFEKGRSGQGFSFGSEGGGGTGGGGDDGSPLQIYGGGRYIGFVILMCMLALWGSKAVYTVRPDEAAVVLNLGKYVQTQGPGIHAILWPLQKAYVFPVTRENSIDIGFDTRGTSGAGFSRSVEAAREGIMLTGDENIIDIDYQVVWNVKDPADFMFNLAEPRETIKAVAESAMREVVGRSELKPMLNRDRAQVADDVRESLQKTLDSYGSGVNIVRLNFDKADPPAAVIDSFRDVQAAAQERDTLKKQAEAYANQRLAEARGQAAQIMEEAEAYKARVVKEAEGSAARFTELLREFSKSPDITRKRLYIEMAERVLGSTDKIIMDGGIGGSGVLPYLPLNELQKQKK